MNKNIEILGQGLYEVKESIDQSNSRDIQSEMGEKVANNIL